MILNLIKKCIVREHYPDTFKEGFGLSYGVVGLVLARDMGSNSTISTITTVASIASIMMSAHDMYKKMQVRNDVECCISNLGAKTDSQDRVMEGVVQEQVNTSMWRNKSIQKELVVHVLDCLFVLWALSSMHKVKDCLCPDLRLSDLQLQSVAESHDNLSFL